MSTISVVGSMNMDIGIEVEKFPEEGQSIFVTKTSRNYGGKGANSAIALAKLGVNTKFFGAVGEDDFGHELRNNLDNFGIDSSKVMILSANTGVAYVIVDAKSENRIIVDPGANEAITAQDLDKMKEAIFEDTDLFLIQLEISQEGILWVVDECRKHGKKLIVDAGPIRGITGEQLSNTYCVSPNKTELEALVGKKLEGDDAVREAARQLLDYNIEHVVVKMGSRGSMYVGAEESFIVDAFSVDAVDTTAAGDSFMAGLSKCLAEGKSFREAMIYGSKCGAIAVTRKGACPSLPSYEDVENFESFLKKE